MDILVCVKRVPDTAENEIQIRPDGTDIERVDLVYSVNEWDNYAVEEAIQICDKVGGTVTAVSVGDEETEEVLRREMAMGADTGILDWDSASRARLSSWPSIRTPRPPSSRSPTWASWKTSRNSCPR